VLANSRLFLLCSQRIANLAASITCLIFDKARKSKKGRKNMEDIAFASNTHAWAECNQLLYRIFSHSTVDECVFCVDLLIAFPLKAPLLSANISHNVCFPLMLNATALSTFLFMCYLFLQSLHASRDCRGTPIVSLPKL
jgi:hypothetical protein